MEKHRPVVEVKTSQDQGTAGYSWAPGVHNFSKTTDSQEGTLYYII
jgi:hypothetical protein